MSERGRGIAITPVDWSFQNLVDIQDVQMNIPSVVVTFSNMVAD